MRINILGVGFDNVTMDEALARGEELLCSEGAHYVVTPNPEIVETCRADAAVGTWRQLDALARTIYLESVSFDELQQLSPQQGAAVGGRPGHLAHRPLGAAQQPHRRLQPAAHAPRAGVYPPPQGHRPGLRPRHAGLRHGRRRGGGRLHRAATAATDSMVLLNHEFGYKTRYAHLSKVLVQPGERVARGQIIARDGQHGHLLGPPPPLRGDPQGHAR